MVHIEISRAYIETYENAWGYVVIRREEAGRGFVEASRDT